ncbi:transcription initiation factor TFIID subunit 1 isoform X2 [Drosophila guanche]|uniref:transcription initiation factor TFIID subunit 1 isoform X2 n=1 Tax=Drosophila guanche TaxID=7266 RepID=UPI0014725F34|nr:transcription initiation factor TFIID subunit 1 isoform X2 [Drosophila guanche]
MSSLVPNIPLPSPWTTPLTHRMAELVDQSCWAVETCLNYLTSLRPTDIRQTLEYLGVHHSEVLFGLLAFVLFQFTKFTAILLLAVFLAYCIFYWWDTFFPGLSQREPVLSRRDDYIQGGGSYLASFPDATEKTEYRDELTNTRLPPFYGTTSTDSSPGEVTRGSKTAPHQTMRNNEAQTVSTASSRTNTTDPKAQENKLLVPMLPHNKLVASSKTIRVWSSAMESKRESLKMPEQDDRKSRNPPTENIRKSSKPPGEKSATPTSENLRKSSTPLSGNKQRLSTPTTENARTSSLGKPERVSDGSISTPVFSHNGTTPRASPESSSRNQQSSNRAEEQINRRSQYPYHDHEQALRPLLAAGIKEFRSRRVSDDPAPLRHRPGSLEEPRQRRHPRLSSQDEGRADKQQRPVKNRPGITRRQFSDEAIERLGTDYRELATRKIQAPISSDGAYYSKLHNLLPSNRNYSERQDQKLTPSNRNNSDRRDQSLPSSNRNNSERRGFSKNLRNNNLSPDSGNRNRDHRPNPPKL